VTNLVDETIVREFTARQREALTQAENDILALERDGDPEARDRLLRYLHTLKGEAGLLGLDRIGEAAHRCEDLLAAGIEDWECLLAVTDWVDACLAALEQDRPLPDGADVLALLERSAAGAVEPRPEAAATGEVIDLSGVDVDEILEFCDEAVEHLEVAEEQLLSLDADPHDREALDGVFRAFHTIKGVAGFCGLTHIQELAHKAENLLDDARRGRLSLAGEALDMAFGAVDQLKHLVAGVRDAVRDDGRVVPSPEAARLVARIVAFRQDLPDDGDAATAAADGTAAPAEDGAPVPEPATGDGTGAGDAAPVSGGGGLILLPKGKRKAAASAEPGRKPFRPAERREVVRVDAERLDRLVDMIGELVIAESMVDRLARGDRRDEAALHRRLDRLDKICRELQEIGMSLRMVPVKPVFQKMARLVRDLARKSGRRIDLVTSGEETEVDKAVVDLIADPLVHMLRNAVDHGIERDPRERVRAGKPEVGVIELRAYHKSGNLVIEVEDDGRGLDRERIRAKAIERGLIDPTAQLSNREIDELIFAPGFSTAEQVSTVSGRGVGMDVVRRNIEELHGSIEIDSEPGQGTLFRIRLPLTLAIIEGLVIRVGEEMYIAPALSVDRLLHPRPEEVEGILAAGRVLRVQEELLPVLDLGELLRVPGASRQRDRSIAVVLVADGRRFVVLADDLVGRQQIVIKSLGDGLPPVPWIGGVAIMPDGKAAPILDAGGLWRLGGAATGGGPNARMGNLDTGEGKEGR